MRYEINYKNFNLYPNMLKRKLNNLMLAKIEKESCFDSLLVSSKGAVNLIEILKERTELMRRGMNKTEYRLRNIRVLQGYASLKSLLEKKGKWR